MIKRIFDILVSLVVLTVLLVPMLVISLLIRIGSPGNPLFCQRRAGRRDDLALRRAQREVQPHAFALAFQRLLRGVSRGDRTIKVSGDEPRSAAGCVGDLDARVASEPGHEGDHDDAQHGDGHEREVDLEV